SKMLEVPILHVNGDDPEAVCLATEIALDYRTTFGRDVVIDLVCYRRLGHNEQDEPMVTQPLMYRAIHQHPTTRKIYSDKLAVEGVIPTDGGDAMVQICRTALDGGRHTNKTILSNYKPPFEVDWKPYIGTKWNENDDTRLPFEHLQALGRKIATVPANFKLHPRVEKIIADRKLMAEGKLPLDWGMAENLAYASAGLAVEANTSLTGEINVSATHSSGAEASITGNNSLIFSADLLDLNVEARDSSSAGLSFFGVSGSLQDISVAAYDHSTYATLLMTGDSATIEGDIVVHAQNTGSHNYSDNSDGGAILMGGNGISDNSDGPAFIMDHNDITVTAANYTGDGAFAFLDLWDVGGTIHDISVSASGYSADALALVLGGESLHINGTINVNATESGDASLVIAGLSNSLSLASDVFVDHVDINVTARGESSDAFLSASLFGSVDHINVAASGYNSAYATISGAISVDSFASITVSAGIGAGAALSIQSLDVNSGSDINLIANRASSYTGFYVNNTDVSFDNNSILVEADALRASTLLYLSEGGGDIRGNVASIDVLANNTSSYASAYVGGDITLTDNLHVEANAQSASAILEMDSLHTSGWVDLNVITGSDYAYTKLGINHLEQQYAYTGDMISVIAEGISSTASLYIGSGNIAGVVLSADNNGARAEAHLGSIHTDRSLIVQASYDSSSASLYVQDITLENGYIEVKTNGSSESATAGLNLASAEGLISTISVHAGGEYSSAYASITADDSNDLTINAISVGASGDYSHAEIDAGSLSLNTTNIDIWASGDHALAELHIEAIAGNIGEVYINAGGDHALAYATFQESDIREIAGNINISADSYPYTSASAGVDFFNGDGHSIFLTNKNIHITASGDNSGASLGLWNVAGAIHNLTVEAAGNLAIARTSIDLSNDIIINGDIEVIAGQYYSGGQFYGGPSDSAVASISLDANGYSTHLNNANISVIANDSNASAILDMGNANVYGSVGVIDVIADALNARASAYINTSDPVYINNGINVEALDSLAVASLGIDQIYFDGGSVNLHAQTNSASAYMNIDGTMHGHIGGISVGADDGAYASLGTAVAWGSSDGDNVTSLTGDISVSAAYGGNA
ncbi:MAG: hypothetical protein EB015_13730, partial [Methylocystaceae bacterium]|nr:hypothetical protein [Methylocystaceae bacterium]